MYSLILLIGLGGAGFGASQLMQEPPQQAAPSEELSSAKEDEQEERQEQQEQQEQAEKQGQEQSEEPDEIKEPVELAASDGKTEGTVTKVEDIVPPSEQPEKVEPKKKRQAGNH
nr:hypothetical protein [Planococcus glaciei]